MDYDDIFNDIGQFGTWQRQVFAVACLCSMFSSFLTLGFSSFIGFTPKFRCFIPQCDIDRDSASYNAPYTNFTIPECSDDSCQQEAECKMYEYIGGSEKYCSSEYFDTSKLKICDSHVYDQSEYMKSFISELDLAPSCTRDDDGWPFEPTVDKSTFIKMCYMFGLMVGSTAFGYLADRIGRKKALFIGIIMSGTSFLVQSFLKNFWAYSIMQIVTGFAAKGVFMIAFVICMEITGTQYSTALGILVEIPYAVGEMALSLLGFLIQQWNILQLVLSIFVLALAIPGFFIPESPRWLIAENKRSEAFVVLSRGATKNGREFTSKKFDKLFSATTSIMNSQTSEGSSKEMGFKTLFKESYVARNTFVLSFNFMVCSMCYYGLAMNQVNLGNDIYVSFALGGVVEIVGYLFAYFTIDHMGRKTILIFCQIVAGIACIVGGVLDDDGSNVVLTLSLIGKFGASASFAICYLYMAELFPTLIRSTAVGLGATASKIGGLAAPFIAGLETFQSCIPLIVFGSSSVIGGMLAVVLPESVGAPLPQSLDEVKQLSQYSKPWWKWVSKTDLAILRYEKTSHLRRCSLPLAKARLESNNRSILRRASLNRVVEGDYCVGGRRHDEVHPSKQIRGPEVKDSSDGNDSNRNECDYTYDGYTLEITDKVRILNIFDDQQQPDVEYCISTGKLGPNNDVDKKSNNGENIKAKPPKRVQFWGLSRE